MCIFAGRVRKKNDINSKVDVQGTNIFVAHVADGKRQVTIYENIVHVKKKGHKKTKTTTSQAMILPVPLSSDDTVELLDLSLLPNFFQECENCFNQYSLKKSRRSRSSSSKYLEVKQVGGYKCSVAENVDDILKINPEVFVLPEDIHQLLSNHYSKGFAFVCCLFDSNVLKTHPIGFVHSVIGENKLFVPTRHEHGHEDGEEKKKVHSVAYHQYFIKGKHMTLENEGMIETTDFADWDHVIYSVNSDSMQGGAGTPDSPKKNVKDVISYIPVKGIVEPKSFHRLTISGTVENVDIILDC